jgi:hypothetical protein
MNGLPDHVEMAVGDGIKRARIERDALHAPVLYRPEQAGKPSSSALAWL